MGLAPSYVVNVLSTNVVLHRMGERFLTLGLDAHVECSRAYAHLISLKAYGLKPQDNTQALFE